MMEITGLSMAARAQPVVDAVEAEKALRMLIAKYPEQHAELPTPDLSGIRVFRVEPTVVSVLDYTMGFGHTDLVTC